jgi:lipopolysaccharide transport system permease protein
VGQRLEFFELNIVKTIVADILNETEQLGEMPVLTIEAGRSEKHYWADLWRYRELFYFLAWRDLLVRYKQTVVGVAWSLIRPILGVVMLTVIFGRVGKMDSGAVPKVLMIACGMLPWQFFSTALSESGNSLVANSNLISKIYFPRLIVPGSSVVTSFVDFLISAAFTVVLLAWYHFLPPVNIVFLPLFVLLAFGASLGAGIWIAALMVEYRDFRVIVPFVVQFGVLATPVGYTTTYISRGDYWRMVYSLNPMVGVIDGFRWAILGGEHKIFWPGLLLSILVTAVLLLSGIWYFRRTEKSFADVI